MDLIQKIKEQGNQATPILAEFAPTFPLTITFDNIKREIAEEVFRLTEQRGQDANLTLAECIKDPKEIQRLIDNFDNIGSIIIELSDDDNGGFEVFPLSGFNYNLYFIRRGYPKIHHYVEEIIDDVTERYTRKIELNITAKRLKPGETMEIDKEYMLKERVVYLHISYI